jgi:hypothetical protein
VHTCKVNVVLQSCKGTAFNSSLLLCFQYLLNSCCLAVKVGPFIIVLVMQTSFTLLPFINFPQKDLGVHFTMKIKKISDFTCCGTKGS